jgi:hypothetical protein
MEESTAAVDLGIMENAWRDSSVGLRRRVTAASSSGREIPPFRTLLWLVVGFPLTMGLSQSSSRQPGGLTGSRRRVILERTRDSSGRIEAEAESSVGMGFLHSRSPFTVDCWPGAKPRAFQPAAAEAEAESASSKRKIRSGSAFKPFAAPWSLL